ncbi:MAG: 3'-5' exonuclease [Kiritimatiellae bacterium]|nr:3'-5' exonuclease [Kiritimatiellia bacterium]
MSSLNLKLDRPLVIFDIESTGISPRQDRIIELAAIKVTPDGQEISKCWLLNPTVPIPEEATKIHGISDEDVAECPTFKDAADEIFSFFAGADLGGFNSDRFDIPCLEEEFARVGLNLSASARRHIDVQKIYHRMEPRDLTAAVKYYLGQNHTGAHGAEADARATLEVLKKQIDFESYTTLPRSVDELDQFLTPRDPLNADRYGLLRWKNGELTLNFGRKRGASLRKLLLDDPNYLRWIMKGDFDTETRMIVKDLFDNGRLPPRPDVQ